MRRWASNMDRLSKTTTRVIGNTVRDGGLYFVNLRGQPFWVMHQSASLMG